MMRGVFITATDTGIGKTVVSASIVRLLRARGVDACGMKPIETGCEISPEGSLVPSDGIALWEASGRGFPLELVSPERFRLPLAPYAAAKEEGREVNLDSVRSAYGGLSARAGFMVVEGVGGLMVPIKKDYFVLDMALEMGLPVIVVASALLGTINHTLLTVRRAMDAGLDVSGVVLNHHKPEGQSPAELTNRRVLEELLPVAVLAEMPYGDSGEAALEGVISSFLRAR